VSGLIAHAIDFSEIAEVAGRHVTREALSMLYTRYEFAATLAEGRDVLEVACGCGPGLGYLAQRARRVIGGDYTAPLLAQANRHYKETIPLVRLDAHALPFRSASFEAVLLYEALYYLGEPRRFVEETGRVLRRPGCLVVSTVNCEWADFIPSALSTRYFSGLELTSLLNDHGFKTALYGAFPVTRNSAKDWIVSLLRRAGVQLHLIPSTMKGKEVLKRLFLGKLVMFPAEVASAMAPYCSPTPLEPGVPVRDFKMLFAVGWRN